MLETLESAVAHHGRRFPVERRHLLKEEERRRWLPPEGVLARAGVQAGETVVDLDAGTGFWTEPLARLVGPDGKVYAVEVEPVMLEELDALVREKGLRNVEAVQSEELRIPLGSGIADLAVLGFVLHETDEPLALLGEIIRLLQSDGRVLVVDWHEWPTEQGPPLEQRLSQEEAEALLGAAGLSTESVAAPNNDVYVLLAQAFRRDDLEMTTPTV